MEQVAEVDLGWGSGNTREVIASPHFALHLLWYYKAARGIPGSSSEGEHFLNSLTACIALPLEKRGPQKYSPLPKIISSWGTLHLHCQPVQESSPYTLTFTWLLASPKRLSGRIPLCLIPPYICSTDPICQASHSSKTHLLQVLKYIIFHHRFSCTVNLFWTLPTCPK